MLLRDANENPFILDLKWSLTSKNRREEAKNGRSLQLAVYAWLLKSTDPYKQIHAGYFMLAQNEIISVSPLLAEEMIDSPFTLEEIWDMGLASLREVLNQFKSGLVEARGLMEMIKAQEEDMELETISNNVAEQYRENGMLYQNPECKYCDFRRICGWTEVKYEEH